ncbi:MAG: amidohydrolase family protein [Aquificae bacterium]|nr:amidohydrolase family protein [Aquificota bacterium]
MNFLIKKKIKNLKLGWVKLFADGSISARTAYLKEPYRDTPSRGKPLITQEELISAIKKVESLGLRLSVHAVGDGAIELVLRAFERAKPKFRYHRIEHALLITPSQIERAKEMGLLLCMQPNFSCFYRELYKKALGEERAKRANPFALADGLGAELIFGTDMMPFDINYAVRCAQERIPKERVLYLFGGWKERKDYLRLK